MDITKDIQGEATIFDQEVTLEQLEQEQKDIMETARKEQEVILENARRVQQEAEIKSKILAKKIEVAKKQKRAKELHKITAIVKNLKAEYGDDFIEVAQKEIKPRLIILTPEQEEQYKKYVRVLRKGYYVKEGKMFTHKHHNITSSVRIDADTPDMFVMLVKTFVSLYHKYN